MCMCMCAQIDTKNYWKMKLSVIIAATHGRSGSFSVNADDAVAFAASLEQGAEETKQKEDAGPDWKHKVIEQHNEIQKLRKQLGKAKEKAEQLIQLNFKLNTDMQEMETKHKRELQVLTEELIRYKSEETQ